MLTKTSDMYELEDIKGLNIGDSVEVTESLLSACDNALKALRIVEAIKKARDEEIDQGLHWFASSVMEAYEKEYEGGK